MIMNGIDVFFKDYCFLINQIILFLKNNFGDGDYLKMKNSGTIPARNYDLKGSSVTGYAFHGNGCGFQFKNFEVDIEFEDGEIGFTSWSFYLFLKDKLAGTNEDLVEKFLNKMIDENKLKFSGKIYKVE